MNRGRAQSGYTLGVNTGPHDAAAALVKDGVVCVVVEQERLSRNKHAFGESPSQSIDACLKHASIGLESVDQIAVGWNVPLLSEIENVPFNIADFTEWLLGGIPRVKTPSIEFVDHHIAHAASAFHTSGMSTAAILVADGRGENASTSLLVGSREGFEVVKTWGTEQSLGHYYGWAAEWAGLGLWGTGKLMGLAAYGQPSQPVPLRSDLSGFVMQATPPPSPTRLHFALHRRELRRWFGKNNFPFAQASLPDVMAYADFAASIQASLEQALLGLAGFVRQETGLTDLVYAGGVALNCAANGVLVRSDLFERVWVPPFPHDAGVSVGAALKVDRDGPQSTCPEKLPSALLSAGPKDSCPSLHLSLPGVDVSELAEDELLLTTAKDLGAGAIVGWYQGRAEVGPRALGARSILCDPRSRDSVARVNSIKGREPWRPLAPAVLRSHSSDFFATAPSDLSSFMLAAVPVSEPARARIPAAVHVDGTARPQIVDECNGLFFRLIEAFNEQTGVPSVINTSFNLGGSPIVHSYDDAVQAFLKSELDIVVLDNLYLRKRRTTRATKQRRTEHSLSFAPWAR